MSNIATDIAYTDYKCSTLILTHTGGLASGISHAYSSTIPSFTYLETSNVRSLPRCAILCPDYGIYFVKEAFSILTLPYRCSSLNIVLKRILLDVHKQTCSTALFDYKKLKLEEITKTKIYRYLVRYRGKRLQFDIRRRLHETIDHTAQTKPQLNHYVSW